MMKNGLLTLAISITLTIISYAQNITGPTSVTKGQTATYTFNNLNIYPSYRWAAGAFG